MAMQRVLGAILAGVLAVACACAPNDPVDDAATATVPATTSTVGHSAVDAWWDHLTALCGQAYEGRLVSDDEADAELAGQAMTMHVRRCADARLEIPFHIGQNRSRTWVLNRTAEGVALQHDHRHEDGSADDVTLYGGHTVGDGKVVGDTVVLDFPVDDFSKQLFGTHGLDASMANVWTMEVVPGERFSYILRRPGRHFQADFDLARAVEPPPAPWGHE